MGYLPSGPMHSYLMYGTVALLWELCKGEHIIHIGYSSDGTTTACTFVMEAEPVETKESLMVCVLEVDVYVFFLIVLLQY